MLRVVGRGGVIIRSAVLFLFLTACFTDWTGPSVLRAEGLSASAAPGSKEGAPGPAGTGREPGRPLWEGSLDTGLFSRYVWQGLNYSDDKPVFQSQLTMGRKNTSVVIWLNYDFQTRKSIDEYDLTIQQEFDLGISAFQLGYTYLTYPHRGWFDSKEIWIEATLSHPLNPSFGLHADFGSGNGQYYHLGLSHDFESRIGTLTPAAILYYHEHYYSRTGFPSVEYDLTDTVFSYRRVAARAKVSYFKAMKDGDYQNLPDEFVYGLNLTWSL